jgi:hypothetical protein
MSFPALAWARVQRVGSQPAKHLLLAIAVYADETGKCWPSRSTLSAETEMSIDTVDRRLKQLEELGFIRREDRPCGPNGTPSRLIFLLFDVERADKDMVANRTGKGSEKALAETCAETAAEPRWGPQNAPPPPAANHANFAQPGAATVRPRNEESLEDSRKDNPSLSTGTSPDPEKGEREQDDSRIREEFQKLGTGYGAHAGMDLGRALKLFSAMNVKTRELAMRKAPIAKAARGAKKHAKDIANWLGDKDFELIAELTQGQAEAAGLAAAKIPVKRGTDAWGRWQPYLKATKDRRFGLFTKLPGGGDGWYFESLYPPSVPELLAPASTGPPDDPASDGMALDKADYG